MSLKNKKVLVVGFGRSGKAAAGHVLRLGGLLAVADRNGDLDKGDFAAHPIDWFLGEPKSEVFLAADLIVVSPGVPWNSPPLQKAREKGIRVINEMELALPNFRGHIIAVTGTNGKTTTVSLIDHLLKTSGKKSLVAGNIGRPLLDCLEDLKTSEFLVLELSSYQLESLPSLKPNVAVWLNVTEDHLEWHENFESYVAAKAKLIRQTGVNGRVIYNLEDQVVKLAVAQIPSQQWEFSSKRQVKLGGWVEEGSLFLKTDFKKPPIRFVLEGLPLKGIHNWENMLAALLAVSPYVQQVPLLQKGLETFQPLPHRVEKICEKKGVVYINDSKGTNVGATLKALSGIHGSIIWIGGGKDKGGDYSPLKEGVRRQVRRAIFIGEAKEKMASVFRDVTHVTTVSTLEAAIAEAAETAQSGETVLFSPACASFDMFRDYVHRGEAFVAIVQSLV